LIASVELVLIRPAATFWICRGAAAEPTLTTSPAAGVPPAKLYVVPPMTAPGVCTAADTVDALPSTTEPSRPVGTDTPLPTTNALFELIVLLLPSEYEPEPVIVLGSPIAAEFAPLTTLPVPMLMEFAPDACAPVPIATAFAPLATAALPTATPPSPLALAC
jgi:hypothetical protein